MSSPRKKLTIEAGDYDVLVICDECAGQWRRTVTNRAAAWRVGALHLKEVHGDTHAAYHARENARWHARKKTPQPPEDRGHGHTRPVRNRRRPSTPRRNVRPAS